jgi:ferric-dicitrate binding protein FerR (iron transport regulator)
MTEETYIQKWLEGTLTEEERRVFEKTDAYNALQRMQESLGRFKAPDYDSQAEFRRLQSRMHPPEAKVIRVNWLRTAMGVAAAMVVLAIALVMFFSNNIRVVETGIAEKRTVVLPDSSLVVLNALSEIQFDEDEWNSVREVKLQGEAFFQVAKGSAFSVKSTSGTVTVLGTEFNVKDRANYFEVICYEGRVGVESEGREERLKAGDLFRVLNGNVVFGRDDFHAFPHLLKNESAFRSVPYSQVTEELERHYGMSVQLRHVSGETLFTGRFTHSDLTLALQSITLPLNLTYEINTDQQRIIITGDTP